MLRLCRRAQPTGKINLPGITAFRTYDALCFGPDLPAKPFPTIQIRPGERITLPEHGIQISCEETVFSEFVHSSVTILLFKYGEICGNITLRSRQAGDPICLHGVTKRLKKLMIEKKIPATIRDTIPVVADGSGLIAVFGLGVASRFLPKPGDRVLKIEIREKIV